MCQAHECCCCKPHCHCPGEEIRQGRCAQEHPHAAHRYYHPPVSWCPGVTELRCSRHDNHAGHNWSPGDRYTCYWCQGYGRATITSDMLVADIVDRLGQCLGQTKLDLVVREIQARHAAH